MPALLGCEIESKTKSEFCAEAPAAVCARLFDDGCAAVSGGASPRYASRDECETAEQQACAARASDSRLTFDEEAAAACVSQIEDQDCAGAARGDLHDCDKVFTDGDAGTAPATALDAGSADGGGGKQ